MFPRARQAELWPVAPNPKSRCRLTGDVVVTVPMHFWAEWIEEGDAVGDPPTGEEWWFTLGRTGDPQIKPGDRVYVVAHRRLRGYAPLTRLARDPRLYRLCATVAAVRSREDEDG